MAVYPPGDPCFVTRPLFLDLFQDLETPLPLILSCQGLQREVQYTNIHPVPAGPAGPAVPHICLAVFTTANAAGTTWTTGSTGCTGSTGSEEIDCLSPVRGFGNFRGYGCHCWKQSSRDSRKRAPSIFHGVRPDMHGLLMFSLRQFQIRSVMICLPLFTSYPKRKAITEHHCINLTQQVLMARYDM